MLANAISSARRELIAMSFGAGLAASVLLGGEPARAEVSIFYNIDGPGTNNGLTFDYNEGQGTLPGGELYGSFTLTCSYTDSASDCVTYDPNAANNDNWIPLLDQQDNLIYNYQILDASISWSYGSNAFTADTAIYGITDDGAYFLQFSYDPPSANPNKKDAEIITLFLSNEDNVVNGIPVTSDPLPVVGRIPLVEFLSVTPGQLYQSNICSNSLPPPARIDCPGGRFIGLSNFNGDVVQVPSPFAAVLLLPVVFLGKLRLRYSAGELQKQRSLSVEPITEYHSPPLTVGRCGE